MEFNLFGLKLGKNKTPLASAENQKIKRSFVLPQNDDDAITVEAVGGFYGLNIDLDGTTRNDTELIYKYREMSMHAECEAAIDDIVSDTIVSEDNAVPVKIILDNIEHNETIKKKIIKEFNSILVLLDFHTKGYEIFRRWYVDSKLVYHKIIDTENPQNGIVEMRYVDPTCIQKVKQYKRETKENGQKIITGVDEYFVYSKDGFKAGVNLQAGTSSGLKISPDAITYVTSGLFDSRNKRTVGHLHKAIKPLNQLRMMEDAVVIYRLSRAPERRIFYIDVGNLPKNKAEQYVQGLMNKYKNKLVYNPATGEVSDEKRHMSMLEDFWLPRREGGKGTEITTLQGAQNLSELEDVKYFQKKLYKSLGVPLSRMDGEQKSFTIGKSTEIQRDEIKFSKMISRLRNKFSELFYDALKTQLILKKIITPDDWEKMRHRIFFDYLKDSYFAELKNNELTQERTLVLNNVQPYVGVYYSQYWVKKNILGLNDEEISEMQQQIDQEKQQAVEFQQAAQQQQQPQDSPEQTPNFGRNQVPTTSQEQPPQDPASNVPTEISPSAMAGADIPVTGKDQPRL
jgi:hypothetical protein